MIESGDRLGAYEVIARLGRGGMASLYLARRSGPADFTRFVAIKVVHEEHAHDRKLIEMLLDEARLAVHVQHPNVVRVEELGEAAGRTYLVMEYVDGVNLSTVLAGVVKRDAKLPIDVAVHVGAEVAAGLHAAHEATDERGRPLNMVHRDVSPQNVMISAHGHVKIIDFGVAKAKGRLTSTAHGAIKGKLAYMSPEQVTSGRIDRRTDVFALGVVLWEMLALRRLFFSRDTTKSMHWIRTGRVPALREHRPEVDPALEAVVMKALALDPDDRYQTAAELRRALLAASPAVTVEASSLAAMVREAARDEVDRVRPSIPPALMEQTLVSNPGRPLPLSVEALDRATREALDGDDAATANGAADVLLLAFGRPDVLDAAVEGREGLAADTVRALVAAHREDLWAELSARSRIRERMKEATSDEADYALASLDLASVLVRLGAYEKAEGVLRKVLDRGQEALLGVRGAEARLALGRALASQDRFDEAEDEYEKAALAALDLGDGPTAMRVALARADGAFRSGRRVLARAEAERARRLAEIAGAPKWTARALVEISRAALATRDARAAVDTAQQAQTLCRRHGVPVDTPEIAPVLALAAELDGRGEDAEALRREARARLIERAGKISDPTWRDRFLEWVPHHAELMRDTA